MGVPVDEITSFSILIFLSPYIHGRLSGHVLKERGNHKIHEILFQFNTTVNYTIKDNSLVIPLIQNSYCALKIMIVSPGADDSSVQLWHSS